MSVVSREARPVELQQEIAARVHRGGSPADVRREIIDPAPLDDEGCSALWGHAVTRPETLRAARRFSPGRGAQA
jgi:hypothetical protein